MARVKPTRCVNSAKSPFLIRGLDYKQYVVQDEKFYRPAEVDLLISDPTSARTKLKWEPAVSFKELVTMMVDADVERVKKG